MIVALSLNIRLIIQKPCGLIRKFIVSKSIIIRAGFRMFGLVSAICDVGPFKVQLPGEREFSSKLNQ